MNQSEQQLFLLNTFREEIEGHIIGLTRGLMELEEAHDPTQRGEIVRELMRLLHTAKGAARMLGFSNVSTLAHAMEELVAIYRDPAKGVPPREQVDLLFTGLDTISELVRLQTRPNPDAPGTPATPLTQPDQIEALIAALHAERGDVPVEPTMQAAITTAPQFSPAVIAAPPTGMAVAATEEPAQGGYGAASSIRVQLDKLDELINLTGELVLDKLQNETHLSALLKIQNLQRQQLRAIEAVREFIIQQTPLDERSRMLGITELFSFGDNNLNAAKEAYFNQLATMGHTTEVVKNGHGRVGVVEAENEAVLQARQVRKIYERLSQIIEQGRDLEDALSEAARERKSYNLAFSTAADELRHNMLGVRMLPLETLFKRFARPIRDLANERNKQVRLVIVGGAVEIDNHILEEIVDPLQHLLRNAVDHGIEEPAFREAIGKPVEGTITLAASQRGSYVRIVVQDDGRGLDPDMLQAMALTKGFISPDEAAALTPQEALNLIFRPGFSTRSQADEISGRGVGMDVVQQNIKRLRGRVALSSTPELGTTVTLEIPLTLASMNALLIRSADELFAISSTSVDSSLDLPLEDLITVDGQLVLRHREQFVPVVRLNELLGLSPLQTGNDKNSHRVQVVLLNTGLQRRISDGDSEQKLGLIVDGLIDEREVVVKALPKFLAKVPNLGGATLLGEEGVALILDVMGLVELARTGSNTQPTLSPVAPVFAIERPRRVLVVDDSLATRELERSIIEAAGYEVKTARDGSEALQLCRQQAFDLVLSDIEMPNLDGFRLTASLKADEQLKHIPVIIVSSRESEEDRRKGLSAGAQAYIVKGAFEQNKLLDTIARLIV